ncbi:hypothetical protein J6590_020709 [Homalodisca vitripennis]|nr:hypothetical protein J6590_020709 [Homalodisca vitripennis]
MLFIQLKNISSVMLLRQGHSRTERATQPTRAPDAAVGGKVCVYTSDATSRDVDSLSCSGWRSVASLVSATKYKPSRRLRRSRIPASRLAVLKVSLFLGNAGVGAAASTSSTPTCIVEAVLYSASLRGIEGFPSLPPPTHLLCSPLPRSVDCRPSAGLRCSLVSVVSNNEEVRLGGSFSIVKKWRQKSDDTSDRFRILAIFPKVPLDYHVFSGGDVTDAMTYRRPRGRLRPGRTTPSVCAVLAVFVWTFTFFGASLATVMGEECDWSGRVVVQSERGFCTLRFPIALPYRKVDFTVAINPRPFGRL